MSLEIFKKIDFQVEEITPSTPELRLYPRIKFKITEDISIESTYNVEITESNKKNYVTDTVDKFVCVIVYDGHDEVLYYKGIVVDNKTKFKENLTNTGLDSEKVKVLCGDGTYKLEIEYINKYVLALKVVRKMFGKNIQLFDNLSEEKKKEYQPIPTK